MSDHLEKDALPEQGDAYGKPEASNIIFSTYDGSTFNISGNPKIGEHVQLGTGNVLKVNQEIPKPKRKVYKAKKPLSTNESEPARKLLENISKDLCKEDALMLGTSLGLTEAKLDEICINFQFEGVLEIKYQILAEWCKKDEKPTIAKLAKRLNSVGRGDISDKLSL